MKRSYIKTIIITGIIIICVVTVMYIGYNIAPGMNPYSERYEFNIPSSQLIENIEKLKNENQVYKIPQIDLPDHYDNNSTVTRYYHIYIYYSKENKILHLWVANDIENKSKSYLNYVDINDGLQLGHWKKINHDYSKNESTKLINQFEEKVLKKLGIKYINKGNSMSIF